MDEERNEKYAQRQANRGGTTKLKRYEELLVKTKMGTSRPNEPLQAVIKNQLSQVALQEKNNSVLERNRALLQYVATIANSNSSTDQFNYEFVESLVKGGADINTADQYGQSIFHEVARSWNCDVAQFLLDVGCDINKQDCYGRSPLHVAAAVNYLEMTEFLLLNHANIDARTYGEHQAPIHYAAKNGATKSLRMLLGFNADINSMDSKQRTPLQLAAEWTRAKTAEVLLDEGAASCLLDSSGNTALSVLIDRLPNLALEALNQLHATDVITMKEFYYIQFLEQTMPLEKENPVQVETLTGMEVPPEMKNPPGMKLPEEMKTPNSGKNSKKKKSSKPKKTPIQGTTPARTPLEMAVITRKFEVVTHPVMKRLIHNKWVQYGRLSTFIDLLFHIVYGILWTTGCMSTPDSGKKIFVPFEARLWLKILGLILGGMTFYDIVVQVMMTMKAQKSQRNWVDWRIAQLQDEKQYCHPRWPQEEKYIKLEIKRVKSLPLLNSFGAWFYLEWIVLFLIIVTTATSVVYYYYDDSATRYLYTRTISIVNLLVWLRLLKYVRPFQGIGTLVIILGETVMDFINWAFLYILLLIPFTASFWINFGNVSIHPVPGYNEVSHLLFTVFRIAVGDEFNLQGIIDVDPVMARILVALYVTAMTIVTLNLLIALLSDTFSRVYSNAVANTIMQRAIKVVEAKRSLSKKRRLQYEEYMRINCSPEVLAIEVKERSSASDTQIAQIEVQNQILSMNELLLERFSKVYGKNKTSDFDALIEDIQSLQIMQLEFFGDLLKIQELITLYSGGKVTFSAQKSQNQHRSRKESGYERRERRKRRSKTPSDAEKEETKGILVTLQEKAISLLHRITGDSEEAKSESSKRERRSGRRRPRSEVSDDERRQRSTRRRRRPKSRDSDENISLVRRSRRRSHRFEESDKKYGETTEIAMVHYEPRKKRRDESRHNVIAEEEDSDGDVFT